MSLLSDNLLSYPCFVELYASFPPHRPSFPILFFPYYIAAPNREDEYRGAFPFQTRPCFSLLPRRPFAFPAAKAFISRLFASNGVREPLLVLFLFDILQSLCFLFLKRVFLDYYYKACHPGRGPFKVLGSPLASSPGEQ